MAQPSVTPEAVAAIVAEVLRRIRAQAAGAAERTAVALPESSGGVVLPERVLSLSVLERLPPGTRRVILSPTAAITPSARDHARERGIEIVRTAQAGTVASAGRPFVIAHADCPATAVSRCAAIARLVPSSQQLPPSGLADVLQAIATHAARDGARGVLLAGRPALAAVLANRSPSLRAVVLAAGVGQAREPSRMLAAAAECSANLLVVDAGSAPAGIERICAEFAVRDLGAVPAALGSPPPAATACSCKGHAH
jgi:hypothetical protein